MAAAAARTGLPPADHDPLEGAESESEEEVESGEERGGDGSEAETLADLYGPDAGSDEDPSFDPAADKRAVGEAALWSGMARLSISARKGRKGPVALEMGNEDIDLLAMVDKLMHDGQLEKLKVYECKAYLRIHKLRLGGKKEELLNRIRDHIEVKLFGDVKYPVSSFVLNCKGDACKGDVVMFEQNIYRRKKGDPRGIKGRLCGQRTNAGRIIKESYGTAKQQHTFTVEIFWSKGYKPWPPLHPLLIKGRNLYKDKTMRQPWPDEKERSRVLEEKHARGFQARKSREVRIHEKEIDKMRRFNRLKDNKSKGKENMNQISSQTVVPQQKVVSTDTVDQRFDKGRTDSLPQGEPGNARQQQISSKQNPAIHLFHQQFLYQGPSVQHGKPEKTRQQQILSRPTTSEQIFKHPTQHDNHRPTPAQQMFKNPQEHNNHRQQQNKVLPQEGTTKTVSILGRAPCLHYGGSGNAVQQQKVSKPTPMEQIRNQSQPLKREHHNLVLPQEDAKKGTNRVHSIDHGKAPCLQYAGPGNAMQQQSSRPALPQQIKNPPQPPKHQHTEVLRQEDGNRTYRVEPVDRRNNNYHNTTYDESAFQRRGTQDAKTHQHGSSGQPHAHGDSQWHQPLRPRIQDFSSRNQEGDYRDHRQTTREQYNPQERHHHNQHGRGQMIQEQYQPQKIHHQNEHDSWRMNQNQYHPQENHHQNGHDSWRMNHNQYHPQENHHQNYRYTQQFPAPKMCRYYQQGLRCPYEGNCKFSHGS
ncbi:hypothetical protein CFC21_064412 [Triticum aestivum]|uniref:C3H1-type domain-containing protein n=2 Tax=Triticum aestivum TaxID=4565 RepID=A0A9R1KK49_WHEAT|nr:zinc finger CCCH domain-containing protein 62-like [Triticum aestivum]KAF7057080.1 hypothetical protein CFC21_064412 [Triticum aestivum]